MNTVTFLLPAILFLTPPTSAQLTRVSVSSQGAQANDESWMPALSPDGHLVAFASKATNLVPSDTNGTWDVFAHDLSTGNTELISVNDAGEQGDGISWRPSVSRDGRWVSFTSFASNLVPGAPAGYAKVFVRDRVAGTTTGVSLDPSGQLVLADCSCISADGRYVAFLAIGTVPAWQVFIRDRVAGTTICATVSANGEEGDRNTGIWLSMSADNSLLCFESEASNLVPYDTGRPDIFVRTGPGAFECISGILETRARYRPTYSSLSADGLWVVYQCLGADDRVRLFLRDRRSGMERVLTTSQPGGTGGVATAAISADGLWVTYIRAGGSEQGQVVLLNARSGEWAYLSQTPNFELGNGHSYGPPSVSWDGNAVAFFSYASNLVPGDTNSQNDVFVWRR